MNTLLISYISILFIQVASSFSQGHVCFRCAYSLAEWDSTPDSVFHELVKYSIIKKKIINLRKPHPVIIL